MNVFKTLYTLLAEQEKKVALLEIAEQDKSLEKMKLDFLRDIKSYIMQFDWLMQERTKQRINYYLVHHCDVQQTAIHYNVAPNTIHVAISYASNKLTNVINKNTLNSIKACTDIDHLQELMLTFYTHADWVKLEQLFLKGIIPYLPKLSWQRSRPLETCKSELIFLATLATINFEVILSNYDASNLAYIISILQQSNLSAERTQLLSLFRGEFTDNDGKPLPIKEQVQQCLSNLAR